MDKHIIPILATMLSFTSKPSQDGEKESLANNPIYVLLTKVILWIMLTGWAAAIGMGGYLVHTISNTAEKLQVLSVTVAGINTQQQANIKKISEIDECVKKHIDKTVK